MSAWGNRFSKPSGSSVRPSNECMDVVLTFAGQAPNPARARMVVTLAMQNYFNNNTEGWRALSPVDKPAVILDMDHRQLTLKYQLPGIQHTQLPGIRNANSAGPTNAKSEGSQLDDALQAAIRKAVYQDDEMGMSGISGVALVSEAISAETIGLTPPVRRPSRGDR